MIYFKDKCVLLENDESNTSYSYESQIKELEKIRDSIYNSDTPLTKVAQEIWIKAKNKENTGNENNGNNENPQDSSKLDSAANGAITVVGTAADQIKSNS